MQERNQDNNLLKGNDTVDFIKRMKKLISQSITERQIIVGKIVKNMESINDFKIQHKIMFVFDEDGEYLMNHGNYIQGWEKISSNRLHRKLQLKEEPNE